MAAFTQRVFSGVQPTGNLHLGNYLGAIRRFVELQDTHDCIYCIVDLHAITQAVSVWGGPEELTRQTREVAAAFIASGIDPKKHIVFNQSRVHQHAEAGHAKDQDGAAHPAWVPSEDERTTAFFLVNQVFDAFNRMFDCWYAARVTDQPLRTAA